MIEITTGADGDRVTLSLAGNLTIDEVGEVHRAILEESAARSIVVEFTRLGSIDLAGLQLIYAWTRAAGPGVEIRGDEALERFGRMAAFAGLPVPRTS